MTARPQHILLVEDNPATRYHVSRVLTGAGFRVTVAENGARGLLLIAQEQPDLVLLDVRLPDTTGFELCRSIKSDPVTATLPVVHLSASHVSTEDKVEGLEGGADAYLTHPVEPHELVATLSALLRVRRAEARYRSILDSNLVGVAILDGRWQVIEANQTFRDTYGLSREDVERGQIDWLELVPEDVKPLVRERLKAVVSEGRVPPVEREILRRDGTRRWVVAASARLPHEDAYVSFVLDVSDRKRAEQERESALAQAQEALRAREDALAIVSHDLRNPLSTILLTARQLQLSGDSGDAKLAKRIRSIEGAANRMTRLVTDLLDLARIEAGGLRLKAEPQLASALVQEAVESHVQIAREKNVALEPRVETPGLSVRCDRERTQQVFSNLIGNALKFTPADRRIRVGARAERGGALFWVEDEGPGIQAEQLPHIFERYFQARRQDRGVGLGLSIAKGLVEAHGGRIWVDSVPGAGATFFFTLPGA